MLGLLPILALFFLIYAFHLAWGKAYPWRETALMAIAAWGILIVLSTEILSIFHSLVFITVLLFWIGICATILFFNIQFTKKNPSISNPFALKRAFTSAQFSRFEYFCISAIVMILLVTGIIALCAAPNNWDSMTYHLSRVAHWIQNQTVAIYPTNIARQILYMPFAEYALLHLIILNHNDQFANLVQWLALGGCGLASSLIAQELGAARCGQWLAALFTLTLPMAILQSTSTQNDLVVGFWILGFVFLLLRMRKDHRWEILWSTGIFMALALLTKGTAYMIAPSLFIFYLIANRRRLKGKFLLHLFGILAASFIFTNSGFLLKYANLHHHFIQSGFQPDQDSVFNKDLSPSTNVSILIKNFGLELNSPSTAVNSLIQKTVVGLHKILRIEISDDKTNSGPNGFSLSEHPLHEDYAGCPIHLILFSILLIVVLIRKQCRDSSTGIYLLGLALTTIIFACSLKWQLWGNRLHLPLFLLACPAMAVIANRFSLRVRWVIVIILFIGCLPWLLRNETRPLIGRNSFFTSPRLAQFFASRPEHLSTYQEAARFIAKKHCNQVGLVLSGDGWEYPFWSALTLQQKVRPRLEHILVENPSRDYSYPKGDFTPCFIVSDDHANRLTVTFQEKTFVNTHPFPYLAVFQPDENGLLLKQTLTEDFKEAVKDSQSFLMQFTTQVRNKFSNPNEVNSLLTLYEKIQRQSTLLETPALNRLCPGLGDAFEQKYIRGVTAIIEGLRSQNEQAFNEGQRLLGGWFSWLIENQSALQKIL